MYLSVKLNIKTTFGTNFGQSERWFCMTEMMNVGNEGKKNSFALMVRKSFHNGILCSLADCRQQTVIHSILIHWDLMVLWLRALILISKSVISVGSSSEKALVGLQKVSRFHSTSLICPSRLSFSLVSVKCARKCCNIPTHSTTYIHTHKLLSDI